MKHIIFLEQYGSLGGGQQVLLELVRAALDTGFQATVLIPEGPCADKLRVLGVQVVDVPEGKRALRTSSALPGTAAVRS